MGDKMKNELVEKDEKYNDLQTELNQSKEEWTDKMNYEIAAWVNIQGDLEQSNEHLESLNVQLEKMQNELLDKDKKYNDLQNEFNQTKEEMDAKFQEKMNYNIAEKDNAQTELEQSKEHLEALNLE